MRLPAQTKLRFGDPWNRSPVLRALQISTRPGEVILDPLGGAGTTFDVCEHLHCHWIGIEIQNCDVIIERLERLDLAHHATTDYVEEQS